MYASVFLTLGYQTDDYEWIDNNVLFDTPITIINKLSANPDRTKARDWNWVQRFGHETRPPPVDQQNFNNFARDCYSVANTSSGGICFPSYLHDKRRSANYISRDPEKFPPFHYCSRRDSLWWYVYPAPHCRFFIKLQPCPNGDRCFFRHGINDVPRMLFRRTTLGSLFNRRNSLLKNRVGDVFDSFTRKTLIKPNQKQRTFFATSRSLLSFRLIWFTSIRKVNHFLANRLEAIRICKISNHIGVRSSSYLNISIAIQKIPVLLRTLDAPGFSRCRSPFQRHKNVISLAKLGFLLPESCTGNWADDSELSHEDLPPLRIPSPLTM